MNAEEKRETIRAALLLYAVTDRSWVGKQTFTEQVKDSLEGGITMLQIREKGLDKEAFLAEAKEMKALAARYHVPLIINDNVEVALEIDADGVHVGQDDMEARKVREILGPNKIIGVTAKTVEQAKRAEAMGADYLGSGAVFGTTTKEDAKNMSLDTLKEICKSVSIPVVAIGGINENNLPELKETGIAGAAVVSGIYGQSDIRKACEHLRSLAEGVVLERV